MSKRMRTLVLAGAAVLVLVALLVVLLLLPQPTQPPDDTTGTTNAGETDTSITLLDKSKPDADGNAITVKSITIRQGDDSYTLIGDEEGTLFLKEYPKLAHDSAAQSTLQNQLKGFTVSRLIDEAPADPTTFGFGKADEPTVSVSVSYSDGTDFAIELGGKNPGGNGRYLRVEGSQAVYLYSLASAAPFYKKPFDYLAKSPITAPEAENTEEAASDEVIVRDVELSGTVRPATIFFQVSTQPSVEGEIASDTSSGYLIKKPYFRSLDMDSTFMDTTVYTGFTAADIAAVNPTAAQLADWGFNKPYSVCTFNLAVRRPNVTTNDDDKKVTTYSYYNVFKYTVKLGNKNDDGLRYAIVYVENERQPLVYLVNESTVTWAATQYDDIAEKMLFYTYIRDVKTITFTVDGVATKFELKHLEEDRDTNLVVTAGGKSYKADDFRLLYQGVMSLQRSGSTDASPSGEAVFSLEIDTDAADARDTSVKMYRHSASKYLVKHSTGETYLVDAKNVESFLEQ